MADLVLTGGTVVDGTGGAPYTADVSISSGRVTEIGRASDRGARRIDVSGLVVAPGFIDPHTHYDAQLLWDPTASPSSQHGVTTTISGNCGFTLAPLSPNDDGYLQRMMARVEGMPLEALEHGLDWSWRSFADYLDRLEGCTAVNAGFHVGHSALRRVVMGDAAFEREANDGERLALVRELRAALAAGALGFSTSLSTSHNDGEDRPVPSRFAALEELIELALVTGEYTGTSLEYITTGCLSEFSAEERDLMRTLTSQSGLPLNWNVLNITPQNPAVHERQLAASDYAAEAGGRVVALGMPSTGPSRVCLHDYFALYSLPMWKDIIGEPVETRVRWFAEVDSRRRLNEIATSPEAGALRGLSFWANHLIGETYAPQYAHLVGRRLGDAAAELNSTPWNLFCDMSVADGLRTVLWTTFTLTPEIARGRAAVLLDPRVMVGGGDAGAHLDRMCGARYPTVMLAELVREHAALSVEQAVHLLTGEPAAYFGLVDRGALRVGAFADLCVFDPSTVGALPLRSVSDLPGGATRLTSDSVGVHYVIVNGTPILEGGSSTGAVPGTLLRSGRDTR